MASFVCLVLAVIAFLVASFGIGGKLGIELVPLGLAFFAASFLFGGRVNIPRQIGS